MRKSQSRGRAQPGPSGRAWSWSTATPGPARLRPQRPHPQRRPGPPDPGSHGRVREQQPDPAARRRRDDRRRPRPLGSRPAGPAYDQVPTITLRGLTERQWRAYVIADNKIALNSGWDEDLLRTEVSELLEMDIGAELMGFDERELKALMGRRHGVATPAPCRSGSWACPSPSSRPATAGGRTGSAPGSASASSPSSAAPRTCCSSQGAGPAREIKARAPRSPPAGPSAQSRTSTAPAP
jgi:hypothetical protein